ncbi:MAG: hypothetical protein BTN85_0870 [Candidatus Methanohalarchaeum thermophilum]|uniref:Uncharacterized protein n=1 Tax=Methanohalarchaeum thermophilum TaxID=1903181 RepID=A0A1Q6DVI2_METT1|nr:MAG: hypothetical protein BTN85_0870 [Candidatus Methanohalarchaeum thermophilum]
MDETPRIYSWEDVSLIFYLIQFFKRYKEVFYLGLIAMGNTILKKGLSTGSLIGSIILQTVLIVILMLWTIKGTHIILYLIPGAWLFAMILMTLWFINKS